MPEPKQEASQTENRFRTVELLLPEPNLISHVLPLQTRTGRYRKTTIEFVVRLRIPASHTQVKSLIRRVLAP